MAQFMFNKATNIWLPGYTYDTGDNDHAQALQPNKIHIAGTIVLFDEATNFTHFGYWMRNADANGNALPKGKFRQDTATDGAGGAPVRYEYGIGDPHQANPQVAHTTRVRAAGEPNNTWNAGQWLWYLCTIGSTEANTKIFDNTGNGQSGVNDDHRWADRIAGNGALNKFGLFQREPLRVGNSPAEANDITFAPGLKWETFKVDQISDGTHVGYLPAIVFSNDDVDNEWGPADTGRRVINMDHSLAYVAYIHGAEAEYAGYVDNDLGPTAHQWRPA